MGVILKIRRLFGLAGFEHDSDHWKSQRSSAIALFILGYWMIYQLLFFLNEASVSEIQQWIAQPLNSMLLALTVLYTFYHSELGLQVIIVLQLMKLILEVQVENIREPRVVMHFTQQE